MFWYFVFWRTEFKCNLGPLLKMSLLFLDQPHKDLNPNHKNLLVLAEWSLKVLGGQTSAELSSTIRGC